MFMFHCVQYLHPFWRGNCSFKQMTVIAARHFIAYSGRLYYPARVQTLKVMSLSQFVFRLQHHQRSRRRQESRRCRGCGSFLPPLAVVLFHFSCQRTCSEANRDTSQLEQKEDIFCRDAKMSNLTRKEMREVVDVLHFWFGPITAHKNIAIM